MFVYDVAPLDLLVLRALPPPGQHVVVGHESTIAMEAVNKQYKSWNNTVRSLACRENPRWPAAGPARPADRPISPWRAGRCLQYVGYGAENANRRGAVVLEEWDS